MKKILVTNQPPELDHTAEGEAVELFQKVIGQDNAAPFLHQTHVFQQIRDGQECVLVAGTVAGKTLAVVIPLLLRIKAGASRKILFLYPTIALLEDQYATIQKVATHAGLGDRVGQIFGGMSRQELLQQLNRDIIVATPDSVYWFLEKNSKYITLLFYGFCHVDDVVIDEAHMLSGLMGYNLKRFLDRISELREKFLQQPPLRTHILTATPTEVVSSLSKGAHVRGRSKVGAVQFEYEWMAPKKDVDKWKDFLQEEVERGFERMLLVLNSAASAHRVFHRYTVEANLEGMQPYLLQFGLIELKYVVQGLLEVGIESALAETIVHNLIAEVPLHLEQLPNNARLTLQLETLLEWGMHMTSVEPQEWEVFAFTILGAHPTRTETVGWWKAELRKMGSKQTPRCRIPKGSLTLSIEAMCEWPSFSIFCSTLQEVCHSHAVDFDRLQTQLLKQGRIGTRYIRQLRGTSIPVVLYTGSMTKKARRGLIQAFQSQEIPRAILISTSAVEAGVDFDVDLLVTEVCTGSSFLQRFGRVGRRGGQTQRVRLISHDANISGRLQEALGNCETCDREEFSALLKSFLPSRPYFSSSPYLKILHDHVTRRIGEAGRMIVPEQEEMEREILVMGGFRYGLRSTLPQIELLDEGVTRDPFLVLPSLRGDQLLASNQPFVIARANVFFDELIYLPWQRDVLIDQLETFKKMRRLLFFHQGKLCSVDPEVLKKQGKRGASGMLYHYTVHHSLCNPSQVENLISKPHLTAPILPYLEAVRENQLLNRYILGLGDVVLVYAGGGKLDPIQTVDGHPLVLKNQMFLLNPHNTTNKQEFKNDLLEWGSYEQELLVMSSGQYGGRANLGDIAVDRVAGACVELYRELVRA